jgi:hypothetical protein
MTPIVVLFFQYVTRHDISRLMEVKRHHKEKKRRQSLTLRKRAPVTPAITFSTTYRKRHAYAHAYYLF